MAKKITMTLNGQEVQVSFEPSSKLAALCKQKGVVKRLETKGEEIRSRAAGMFGAHNYGVRTKEGATRTRVIVYTGDKHAVRSNRVHNTLKKALGGS